MMLRHDDKLNWTRLNYVFVIFGILLTAFIWSFAFETTATATVFAVMRIFVGFCGCLLAWAADSTFQEGLRCLRADRRRISALERTVPPVGKAFFFAKTPFNQRDIMESSPLAMFLLSLVLIGVAILDLAL